MKSILLASASVIAFAGAAAAEVSFSGEATLGYNDDVEDGFFWDGNVAVALSQDLDNGLTAGADFDFDFADGNVGSNLEAGGFVVYIESEMAALRFGDLDPVAEGNWGGVDGSEADDFLDQDAFFDYQDGGDYIGAGFDSMLVGEISYGNVDGMVSFGINPESATGIDEMDGMQLYVTGDFGGVSAEMAYQQKVDTVQGSTAERIGLAGSTTFGGADVTVAFANEEAGTYTPPTAGSTDFSGADETSFGVDVSYPVGPVTAGAYFTSNDNAADMYGLSAEYSEGPLSVSASYENDVDGNSEDFDLEGSYDVGNGLTVLAGVVDMGDAYYVAGDYDLGGGAGLLVSFAEDDNNATNDEIGDPEYNHGSTVEVSFEF